MRHFPTFHDLQGRHVVIFGEAEVTARRVRLLRRTPAKVVVVTDADPQATPLAEFGTDILIVPEADADHVLEGAALAFIAREDASRTLEALALVRRAGVAVNVTDRPELCDFILPSILDRGEVLAAFSTGGAAPVLARRLRAALEVIIPQSMGEFATLSRSLREEARAAIPDFTRRRQFWEEVFNGPAAEAAYAGDLRAAERETRALMARHAANAAGGGVVHIVGAGPGDPELLTLKALRLLQAADVVFHDRLVGEGVLDLVRRDARLVAVGKARGHHSVAQEDIHRLMVEAARAGQRVVRLKGGDPFIFGRGGEELAALQAEGVPVHVVPGISAMLGCAASAGIPLTHRDHAQALTLVTGHAQAGGAPDLDWSALSAPGQTLVVFMGVDTAAVIAQRLMRAGRGADTPVAVIENGTRRNERRLFGRLSELGIMVEIARISGPALLIVGEVAGLSPDARDALIHNALTLAKVNP
jgi:uroporphyrin-III C-methyltransferase/precorrin-2 dehydrogenase/sirohydrochlorin ferrochelatase